MKIGQKISISFLTIAVIFTAFGYFIFLNETSVESLTTHFSDEIVIELHTLHELKSSSMTVLSATMEIILIMDERNFMEQEHEQHEHEQHEHEQIKLELEFAEKHYVEGKKNFENSLDIMKDLSNADQFEQNSTIIIKEKWNTFLQLSEELITTKERGISGIEIIELKEEFEVAETNLLELIDESLKHEFEEVITTSTIIDSSFSTNFQIILWGIITVIVASIVIGFGISRSILKPINNLKIFAKNIQDGKLESKVTEISSDEIGDLTIMLNATADKLKEVQTQKNDFSAMISHELKTPVFPIMTNCQMLKDPSMLGELSAEQLEAVNLIESMAYKLNALTSDILDAQKIETDHMTFNKTKFKVSELFNEIKKNTKSIISEKNISFSICSKEFEMYSDRDRLFQLFLNLVHNAIDFVANDTGKIEIDVNFQNRYIIFSVKDNGIGIHSDNIPKLFKKFYQIDTKLKRSHGGTGLGLVICKGIIEGLDGKIWINSELGKGTVVYFCVPISETSDCITKYENHSQISV